MSGTNEAEAGFRTTLFLSYSRRDSSLCAQIAAALDMRGYATVFDRADHAHVDPDLRLTAQDEWWSALKTMIAASDVMVFLVSPDSAASAVCDDEIAYARALGKRVIPVLGRPIDFNTAPERLRAMNVEIDFSGGDHSGFQTALGALCRELDLDIVWHRLGARLMRQADQWEKSARPHGQLLRAEGIAEADAWAFRRPRGAPEPGALLTQYLEASRAFEQAQRDKQRRLIGRAFVKPCAQAYAEGRHDVALRLAATGAVLAEDPDFALVPELWRTVARAVFECRLRAVLAGHDGHITEVCAHPERPQAATASYDQTVRLWDIVTGRETLRLHGADELFTGVAFSADGLLLLARSEGGAARLWDLQTGREAACHHDQTLPLELAAFRNDDRRIVVVSSDRNVITWETRAAGATAKRAVRLAGPGAWVHAAALSPDATRISGAPNDRYGPPDHAVRVWDIQSGAEVAVLGGHDEMALSTAFSPSGAEIVTASQDRTAIVWNIGAQTSSAHLRGHGDWVSSAVFSPDGGSIATTSRDATMRLWDAVSGAETTRLQEDAHHAAFTSDGRHIITAASPHAARVWSAIQRQEAHRLCGHRDAINRAAFSPDGARILTASGARHTATDSDARLWDATTGEEGSGDGP